MLHPLQARREPHEAQVSRNSPYEMDTVVSSTNGTGGLLVLVDRKSRRYVIEKLEHVTQDDVVAALRRMAARKALGKVRSITTDNGCETSEFSPG